MCIYLLDAYTKRGWAPPEDKVTELPTPESAMTPPLLPPAALVLDAVEEIEAPPPPLIT